MNTDNNNNEHTIRTAVVTGASTGIGRSIAIALAQDGAFVYCVARNRDGLAKTKKLIEQIEGGAEVVSADLADLNSINNLIKTVLEKTKHIDILVNVAGIWHGETEAYAGKSFQEFSQKVILDTYSVGTIAPTLLAHALIPHMSKNSKILNISGTFESGAKGWLPYFVSKKAIEDLTIGLAEELKEKDIQVNCISPSDVNTEQYQKYFPEYAKDAISPETIAHQAVYL